VSLFVDFLTEQRIISAADYSKLLKARLKPAFRSKRRDPVVKSVSPPQWRVSSYQRCDNRNVGGNALRGTVTHRLQSWPGAKRFLPVRSTQRGRRRKRFRSDDEVKLFVQWWLEEQICTVFERGIRKFSSSCDDV
jgi:hypothetical protein